MLKRITYAMIVSGVLLAPVSAAAESSIAPGMDVVAAKTRTPDRDDSPFPVEGTPVSYGVKTARAGNESPYPDQSKSKDYGIRVTKADESVFPDQSKSNDYGIRVAA